MNPPASAADAYPDATFTYVIVPQDSPKASTLKAFLQYAIGPTGQAFGPDLGYPKLPSSIVDKRPGADRQDRLLSGWSGAPAPPSHGAGASAPASPMTTETPTAHVPLSAAAGGGSATSSSRASPALAALGLAALMVLLVVEVVDQAKPSLQEFGAGFLTSSVWNTVKDTYGAADLIFGHAGHRASWRCSSRCRWRSQSGSS